MARSFKINVTDDKGRPIALAWCRAYKSTDNTEVETQYTDASGNATFAALTDNVDCYIIALWGTQSKFFFNEATVPVSDLTAGTITADVVIANTFKTAASPNPRIEITQTLIAGYSDATTKQFYLQASDGKAMAGGGSIILDSNGLTAKGQNMLYQYTDGVLKGKIYGAPDGLTLTAVAGASQGVLVLTADTTVKIGGTSMELWVDYTIPGVTNAMDLGSSTYYWRDVISKVLTLSETTTPSAITDFGKIYTKNDNKLYFQDGAGTEHTVAFV